MDGIKDKTLGTETAAESSRMKDLCSNIQRLASGAQPPGLRESRDVKTPLSPTLAHPGTSFCVPESYIFIFALGGDVEANVEMGVKGQEPWLLGAGRPEPPFIAQLAIFFLKSVLSILERGKGRETLI